MAFTWEETAANFRAYLNSKIPTAWTLERIPSPAEEPSIAGPYLHKFLSAEEIAITEKPAEYLLEAIKTGKWKAVDVAKAFCHRSALAHQFLNCLLEIRYDDAIKEAEALDKYFQESGGQVKGKLHGLPVSLKDQYVIAGLETTMGYVGYVGQKVGKTEGKEGFEESLLVKELRNEGALVFCKVC
jgi:amidase